MPRKPRVIHTSATPPVFSLTRYEITTAPIHDRRYQRLPHRVRAAFPGGVRWCFVADRGVPSAALFAQLRQGGTDFSVRPRLSDWVTARGVYAKVSDHLVAGRLRHGQR